MLHRALALLLLFIPALAAADSLPIVADTHTRYLANASSGVLQFVMVTHRSDVCGIPVAGCKGFASFELSGIPTGAPVDKAQLRVWVTQAYKPGVIDVAPVLGPWTEAGLTG